MKWKNFIEILIKILREIKKIKDDDIEKLNSKDYTLEIKIVKIEKRSNPSSSDEFKKLEIEIINLKNSRDEAKKILLSKKNNELKDFTKYLKVHIMNNDKKENVVEKILRHLIDAEQNSNAIHSK